MHARLGQHDMHTLYSMLMACTLLRLGAGKWQYEVILHTAGIQQLGWATISCPFTSEEGVGDAPDR